MKDFTRYIFEDHHFSKEQNRVKPSAFVPWPRFETSVANVENLEDNIIWQLGDQIRGLRALARGDFNVSDLTISKLNLQIAEPPPRHWHIIGWDQSSKAVQKAQALELAPLVELHVR
jgi:hypothetical protein